MAAELRIVPYDPTDPSRAGAWDAFAARDPLGTIFHSQNFLAYHGRERAARFAHLEFRRGEALAGVLPLGVADGEAASPYGASFGGPLLGKATFAEAAEAADTLAAHARERGWRRLRITPAPFPYHAAPDAYLEFALLKRGFRLANRELCQGLVLRPAAGDGTEGYDYACRKALRKAGREGVETGPLDDVGAFHAILAESRARLGAAPTHTAAELETLRGRLGAAFALFGAYRRGELLGGLLGFAANARVFLNFYTCSRPEARDLRVDNALNHAAILWARARGFGYYDFGTSSIGMRENEGLIRFKEAFGGGSHFRDTYLWEAP